MSTLVTERPLSRAMPAPLSIFEEMDRLTRQIRDRAFGLFQERGGIDGFDQGDWIRAESELLKPIPIEVEEQDKEIIVRAEVPGFDARDLSVTAEPYGLRIYGKVEKRGEEQKKEEAKKGALRHYTEISSNEILRQVTLPSAINPDKAVAHLNKGILELHLPKAAPPKLIEVKSA